MSHTPAHILPSQQPGNPPSSICAELIHPIYKPSKHPLLAPDGDRLSFVYLIEGPSGVYVGCCKTPGMRWTNHRYKALSGSHLPLYRGMREHGFDAFTMRLVAVCRYEAHSVERHVMVRLYHGGANVLNRDIWFTRYQEDYSPSSRSEFAPDEDIRGTRWRR